MQLDEKYQIPKELLTSTRMNSSNDEAFLSLWHERNELLYSDKLGPSVEWFLSYGLEYSEIIARVSSVNGENSTSFSRLSSKNEKIIFLKYYVPYELSAFIIEVLTYEFKCTKESFLIDIDNVWCDLLMENNRNIRIHYHECVGLLIMALDDNSITIATKMVKLIERKFAIYNLNIFE